jgi:hypothetical protein
MTGSLQPRACPASNADPGELYFESENDEVASWKPSGSSHGRSCGTVSSVPPVLELQKRVKPDPEGLAVRDYINHDRS